MGATRHMRQQLVRQQSAAIVRESATAQFPIDKLSTANYAMTLRSICAIALAPESRPRVTHSMCARPSTRAMRSRL